MKLKYKQIIIFIIIIIASSLPLSLFILNRQEADSIAILKHRGVIDARMLARSTTNILFINGGDIMSSRIDAAEMITMFSPLNEDGLVYADSILISSRKKYNGLILASYVNENILRPGFVDSRRVDGETIERLLRQERVSERYMKGLDDLCYEFAAADSLPGKAPLCISRLVFSKSAVQAPIRKMKSIVYGVTAAAIIIVTIIGYFLGQIIARPVENLISGVEHLGGGDFSYRIPVRSGDEFGRLATTFNHLAHVVSLEISEMRKKNEELKRLDILKDEFLANISHELRTPLYGIIGLTESLIESVRSEYGDDAIRELTLIAVSGRRLSQLINNILDFSKLKHSDLELQVKSVDMYSVTQLVISILYPLILEKGLTVENRIAAESVYVWGDEYRLQQIMLNLLGNAVKFTEEGTIVVTSAIALNDEGKSNTVITVEDSGVGVPEDKRESIFESFEQADGSIDRMYSGSGLGLAITKKLVELHGGRIWMEEVPDGGSRFSFTMRTSTVMPLYLAGERRSGIMETQYYFDRDDEVREKDERKVDSVPDMANGGKSRLLVIDDEPVILQVLKKNLQLAGYRVDTVIYGADALEYIEREGPPDLIILDIMLPRMSGYEVCRKVREQYSSYELPILMLTARNKQEDLIAGFEAGANDYIGKPVERQELLARVNSLLSFKQSAALAARLGVINRDIEIAHEIQQTVLLKEIPRVEGLDIAVSYRPMEKLGGDFYDIQRLADGRIAVLIADVSGHGIPAAFICAMLKVAYSFYLELEEDPALIFARVNRIMCSYLKDQYITAAMAILDVEKNIAHVTNGGHWPVLIAKKSGGEIVSREIKGFPFGWVEDVAYKTMEVSLEKGDRLIFYTDGVVEVRNAENEMFFTDNFNQYIGSTLHLSVGEFVNGVMESVALWGDSEQGLLDDDATIIAVDIQ